MRTATDPADTEALAELAARVREKRQEATGAAPGTPPGCPVCTGWRLRDGEERDDDGRASVVAPRPRRAGTRRARQ